jgi:hypothetical protein
VGIMSEWCQNGVRGQIGVVCRREYGVRTISKWCHNGVVSNVHSRPVTSQNGVNMVPRMASEWCQNRVIKVSEWCQTMSEWFQNGVKMVSE